MRDGQRSIHPDRFPLASHNHFNTELAGSERQARIPKKRLTSYAFTATRPRAPRTRETSQPTSELYALVDWDTKFEDVGEARQVGTI
jgi:hypothetical protein